MAKKEFSSPAAMFFDERLGEKADTAQEAAPEIAAPAQVENAPVAPQAVPAGYCVKIVPEPRTKRTQIVLAPSLYKAASALAKKQKISFNEFVNSAISQAVSGQGV